MKFLYIGQYSEGTTSKMRADTLSKILQNWQIDIIDTNIPFYNVSKVMRSIGFRYKKGTLITKLNNYILSKVKDDYDFIWIDKAIFIKQITTQILKTKTKKLIHYTPDAAFIVNKSAIFEGSISLYDYVISTKSYEIEYYKKKIDFKKFIYTTQGFDKNTHKPTIPFEQKKNAILFIGRYEKNREQTLDLLLKEKINVSVSGNGWSRFAKKHITNKNFSWLGKGLYGDDYSKTISSYKISWGALSKLMPELHTTRTFEIPACGTALISERNSEIESFFKDDEIIFYSSEQEFIEKIKYYFNNQTELKQVSEKGYKRVITGGYDYKSILTKLLKQAEII